jgi:hypothetical protein
MFVAPFSLSESKNKVGIQPFYRIEVEDIGDAIGTVNGLIISAKEVVPQ